MSSNTNRKTNLGMAEELVGEIKLRIKLLLIASTLVVAIAFGTSFYFSLISSETAIARQVPELEAVVGKFKNLLILNTIGVVAIIVGSFYLLSSIVTTRIFRPLGSIRRSVMSFAEGRMPRTAHGSTDHGAFADWEAAFMDGVDAIAAKEEREAAVLNECLALTSQPEGAARVRELLTGLLHEKKVFLGIDEKSADDSEDSRGKESVFMQPV